MKRFVYPLAGLMTGLLSGSLVAASPCESGPPSQGAAWLADFDGNGRVDRLWLLPAADRPDTRGRAVDPWQGSGRPYDAHRLALVIERGRGAPGCLVIQNRRFFATPIWEGGDVPVHILRRGTPEALGWRRVARGWRGDGVLLGTEAGVDLLLFWDGRRPRIAQRNEIP